MDGAAGVTGVTDSSTAESGTERNDVEITAGNFTKTKLVAGDVMVAFLNSWFVGSWTACVKGTDVPFECKESVELHLSTALTDDPQLPAEMLDALLSMTRGEKSVFEFAAVAGFGSSGRPPSVPPDADLVYEITCSELAEEVDKSPNSDEGIMLKLYQPGPTSYFRCPNNVEVAVRYRMFTEEGELVYDVYEDDRAITFVTGSFQVVPGLEMAIRKLGQGARGSLKLTPPYAYGPTIWACPHVGTRNTPYIDCILEDVVEQDRENWKHYSPNLVGKSIVFKDLEILHFESSPHVWELETEDDKRLHAEETSNLAKYYLRHNRLYSATVCFYTVRDFLEQNGGDATDSDILENQKLLPNVQNNLALCNMKRGRFMEAISLACKVLSSNFLTEEMKQKALYRRGVSLMGLEEYDKARQDLETVRAMIPKDKFVAFQLEILDETIRNDSKTPAEK